jgi:hypothetical protein
MSRFPTGSLFTKKHTTIMEEFKTGKPLIENFTGNPIIEEFNIGGRPLIEGSTSTTTCSDLKTANPSACPTSKFLDTSATCSGSTCTTTDCCKDRQKCKDSAYRSASSCVGAGGYAGDDTLCKTDSCSQDECCTGNSGASSVRDQLADQGIEFTQLKREAKKFVIDSVVSDRNKKSCSYWQSDTAKRDKSLKRIVMMMGQNSDATKRSDPDNQYTQNWKGTVIENRNPGSYITAWRSGDYFNTVEDSDFKSVDNKRGGGTNTGPMGGFDYAICGEKYNVKKHGKIRTQTSIYDDANSDHGKVISDTEYDIPGKPFTGDCIGLNAKDFKRAMKGCLTTKELYEQKYGEFLVCPPNNKNKTIKNDGSDKDTTSGDYLDNMECKIKNCGCSKYSFPFQMAICKRGTKKVYHVPVDGQNSGWKCGNVEYETTELDANDSDTDYKCPSEQVVEGIMDRIFTKSVNIKKVSKHTDTKPVPENVLWNGKDYRNRDRIFLNNMDPCYNFGKLGGGDETSKLNNTDGTQIFYDELRVQNENNSNGTGWFNMKDNGWVKKSGSNNIWEQRANKRVDGGGKFNLNEKVWVLVNESKQDNHNTHLKGKKPGDNSRWIPGIISGIKANNKYNISSEKVRESKLKRNYTTNTSRLPSFSGLLNNVSYLRIRRRETSSTNSSPIDQIWADTICSGVNSPGSGKKPLPPDPDMGCSFAPATYKTKGMNCYLSEKAASRIPLLFQRQRDVCKGGTAGEGKVQCQNIPYQVGNDCR